MRETAWAIEIEPENYDAILSEAGRSFDREGLMKWVAQYGEEGGYFVRDTEQNSLTGDCSLMSMDHFFTLYSFVDREVCDLPDPDFCDAAHFRPIRMNRGAKKTAKALVDARSTTE